MVLKSFGILLVLSLFCLSSMAQKLKTTHTRLIGGTGYDVAYDAIYDPRDKSIVFTGYTEDSCGTGDLPPCPAVYGSRDLIVGKIDSNRNLVWIKQYGGSNTDAGSVLDIADRGYIVLGATASFDGDVMNNHGNDIWALKLDVFGNLEWEKCFGSVNGGEGPGRSIQTNDGGYIIAGGSSGSGEDVPFQYVNSPFTTDWLILKTDSSGNKKWAKTIGGTKDEGFIAIFEFGHQFYVAGYSASHDHECDDISWHGSTVLTGGDYFLIVLDSAGNYLWNKSYGGTGDDQMSDALFDERDSSIVMVGHTTSTDYMVPASISPRQDVLVIKVDLHGNLKWSKVYGDNSNEWMAHIRKSPIGNGYLVSCRADINSPVPPYYFGDHNDIDTRLFLVDSAGSLIADKVVGGPSPDMGIGLVRENGFAVIGRTNSQLFAEGITSQKHGSNMEIFATLLDYWPASIASPINAGNASIRIYPSPAGDKLNASIGTEAGVGILSFFDQGGRLVWQKKLINSVLESIDVSQWARGTYITTWQSETGNHFRQNILLQ